MQDNDHALVSITCFKKVADEFKQKARENKFAVRDFAYDEEQLKSGEALIKFQCITFTSVMISGKNELTKLHTDKKKQFGPLVRWLKVNFGECFTAWIHVKVRLNIQQLKRGSILLFPFQALRVFVESVLRFGLPVNFQGMVLNPQRKQVKKLRETLNDLYLHLDSAAGLGGGEEIPGNEIITECCHHIIVLHFRIGRIWSGGILSLRVL